MTPDQATARIETLARRARRHLAEHEYRDATINGVDGMDIARALDQLRAAEATLRKAFGGAR